MTTRFAPSPTGPLHLGHAYAAMVAQHLARTQGGRFLLRFEDIDHTRVRERWYEEILEDLAWLELRPDEPPLRQLSRSAAHAAALESLRRMGVVYPCFCTRREIAAELAALPAAPHHRAEHAYPGTCRSLTTEEIETHLARNATPAWRFHAAAAAEICGPLAFTDLRLGPFQVDPFLLGDTILARRDIGTSYHLAVVVDDAFQGVTHVTRGEDLLDSTHLHRMLQALLDLPTPVYLHHALVTDSHGRRLAKRDLASSLRSLRESGLSPSGISAILPPLPA